LRILLELRPAFDGHSGIPQETRLLFRGLGLLDGVQVDGLLQSSNRLIASGLPVDPAAQRDWPPDRRVNRLSRVVVSLQPGEAPSAAVRARRTLRLGLAAVAMVASSVVGRRQPLTRFEPARFEDFLWRALFARTLSPDDFAAVTSARYRVARVPWSAAHASALLTRWLGAAVYPRLDTRGYDVMIAETPYPGRVSAPTQLVVRYHDAVPLLMPHTISDRAYHLASHYHALRRNVHDGAWFACVSEASRQDLLSVFPEVESRAVTIPNMVSNRYFAHDSSPARIVGILRTRANRIVESRAAAHSSPESAQALPSGAPPALDYLLAVSTLEPRKNQLGLLSAWERLRASGHPNLKLVLVGKLGWDHEPIVSKLLPWVARGQVQLLDDVPSADLRLLYRHARATVCPSFGEGFGFSGIEAMRCGGVVAASDIPAHREVYGQAAEYFNVYSAASMAAAVARLLGPEGQARRCELTAMGADVAARYLPERVLPQWQAFFDDLSRRA